MALAVLAASTWACSSSSDEATETTTDTAADVEPAPPSQPTTTAAAAPSTAVPATSPTAPAALATGEVWPLDFPDPFVLAADGSYHAFGTTSGRIQVQRLDAADGATWTGPDEALVAEPAWAIPRSAWAPAVLEVEDGYVLYYAVGVAGTDQHCISVADAPTPTGPYRDESTEPLVCPADTGGAIDANPFRDEDGSLHLLWKNDGITLRSESRIWSQMLSADGRRTIGPPRALIATDQAWEFPHVEAPSMLLAGDTYWLAYSANWWNQEAYGIGLARCETVMGPCTKPFDGPILSSAPEQFGPGGAELFIDDTGRPLLVYHAWRDEPGYPGHRALHIEPIDLDADPPVVGRAP